MTGWGRLVAGDSGSEVSLGSGWGRHSSVHMRGGGCGVILGGCQPARDPSPTPTLPGSWPRWDAIALAGLGGQGLAWGLWLHSQTPRGALELSGPWRGLSPTSGWSKRSSPTGLGGGSQGSRARTGSGVWNRGGLGCVPGGSGQGSGAEGPGRT